jgi:hypothetical protein
VRTVTACLVLQDAGIEMHWITSGQGAEREHNDPTITFHSITLIQSPCHDAYRRVLFRPLDRSKSVFTLAESSRIISDAHFPNTFQQNEMKGIFFNEWTQSGYSFYLLPKWNVTLDPSGSCGISLVRPSIGIE